MKKSLSALLILMVLDGYCSLNNQYTLLSPDQKIKITINTDGQISYSVEVDSREVLSSSPISMTLSDGKTLGLNSRVARKSTHSVNEQVTPLFENSAQLTDQFNELVLRMRDNYAVIFRAYNNGVAYRFQTFLKGEIIVENEEVNFNFGQNPKGYFIEAKSFETSFEGNYSHKPIAEIDPKMYAILPVLIEPNENLKILLTEADLLDYPGMYLKPAPGGLKGIMPNYPKSTQVGGHRNFNRVVTARENFIAKTNGTRTFPWRAMVIAREDRELIHNHLVYLLSTPAKLADVSWIKPGKVAWDWWCALNLEGVDFKTGINTETYKYFIDFAARNGIDYVNLDEGWSDQQDLMKINSELDLQEIIAYAKEKNVRLILWCVWHVIERQMQEALDQFEKWGIAGVKVDFMDRDDQEAVNFYEKMAVEAAKRKMIVNFHGAYKPTGLRRTYPNVINREGVLGLEYNKWSKTVTPQHDVEIPFIRMAVGPMDYTPGAMRNGSIANFAPVFDQPMSQGTRCHQLAMYVAFDSPLEMLSDAPTSYEKEPAILDFLSKIPTVWDETVVLDGKIGDFLVIARRKADIWYIGALGDENAREIRINPDFLKDNAYKAMVFSDGINADKNGQDFRMEELNVNRNRPLTISLAPGGGWTAVLRP